MKFKILDFIFFLISLGFFAHYFLCSVSSKMVFLALFDSILTLESHLSHYCEGINTPDRVYILYSVNGFNLPKESHHNHLSPVGKAVVYQFCITWVIYSKVTKLVLHPFEIFNIWSSKV